MKFNQLLSLALGLAFLAGCTGQGGNEPTATSQNFNNNTTLPAPAVHITNAPDPQTAINKFLEAWKNDDYAAMYPLLTKDSQSSISLDDFVTRYQSSMDALTLKELTYEISPFVDSPAAAQISFRVNFKTLVAGDLSRDMTADIKLENGQWRIAWDDGLVMPELKGGGHLQMDYSVPPRGLIFDRNNHELVVQTDVMAVGIIPAQINPNTEGALIGELSRITGLYPGAITALYADSLGANWYIPVGEAVLTEVNRLAGLGGAVLTQYNSRFYFEGGIAPQTVGYVSPVPREQLSQYLRSGYSPAARIGQTGIEKWGEQYLAGKTGGTIYVIDKDGKVLSTLGKSDAVPASSITLTIDQSLQSQAQKALTGFRGSIVVMERDTGRVLAMVSSPKYDPNLFEPENTNSGYALGNLLNDPSTPMLDRATQGQYPLGSVFKVITFSAALESGTYTPETNYPCGYDFTELPDRVLHDWTWEHFMDEVRNTGEGRTQPSGNLDLTGGLMRSCNPYFWHIGLDLYNQGRVSAIADMARGFGLGSRTGIGQVDEAAGTIVNPPSLLDAVNQAIGQGDVLVTPLQVADFMAAIGNGGTLYRPQVVEKTTDGSGVQTSVFKPESRGVLPMKPETLAALRTAMLAVIRNRRGTAYQRFTNLTSISIYGKTGTAESNTGTPHAWFAGYTDAQNPALPDISIAVIAENAGEGSVIAAPIFKRVVEIYFFGKPRTPYSWESNIGITRTPTLPVTPTPPQ
ncbi:MAG: penicillin-binding transpeptidase domain-containing protein [Chloroflexi bacterium]|nr:penicillin-binding transpeptidase domain-containing protein [Chloroflexota bacterium]